MKFNRNVLIMVFLVSIVLSVLFLSPLEFVPFRIGSVKATTSTFTLVTDTDDGRVHNYNANYNTVQTATTGSGSTTENKFGQKQSGSYYYIYRCYLRFDTSAIDDGATITAAKLRLYGLTDESDVNFVIRIQGWTEASDGISAADYNGFDGTNYDDGSFNTASFSTSSYNDIIFSTFTIISDTGYTDLCIRSKEDVDASPPESSTNEYVLVQDAGDANKPKLEVIWTSGDTTSPTYSDVDTNTTIAGASCKFYTKWTDETGLATTGGSIFGTNNTGTWQNETWTAFSANPDWGNVTKTLNSSDIVVGWCVWGNDTSNNWNNTGIQTLSIIGAEYDYVDNNTSDVDSSVDKGTHSNFDNEKACDGSFDTLTEGGEGESFGIMTYRKNITINHNYVDGDQTNFPVLIDIYDDDLHDDVQADGDDIMFKSSADVQLDHEIELFTQTYNATHAHLVAWVEVSLSGLSNTIIQMLYGNSTCGSQENPTGVWNSNFKGIWHLTEDASGTGTADLYEDSTSNNNDGDDYVSATGKTGKINSGQEFDGSDDYTDHGNVLEFTNGEVITIEVWVYATTFEASDEVINKKYNYNFGVWQNSITFGYFPSQDEVYTADSTDATDGEWNYIAVTYTFGTGSSIKLYKNGGEVSGSWAYGDGNVAPPSNANPLQISPNAGYFGTYFDGSVDEVRISNVARSTVWINTTYQNVHNLLNFFSVGSEETAEATNYELDLEIQWTNANYTRTNEELCIKVGSTDAENIRVYVWQAASWSQIDTDLDSGIWNNYTITSYLTSTTFTVRFLGGTESSDTNQDSWQIDCTLIHTWTVGDTAAPTYSNIGINTTQASQASLVSDTFTNEDKISTQDNIFVNVTDDSVRLSDGTIYYTEDSYDNENYVNETDRIYVDTSNGYVRLTLETIESTPANTSSQYGTRLPSQHKIFYAVTRYWFFYHYVGYMQYRTSTDGSTWSDAINVDQAPYGAYFDIRYKGGYLHYISSHSTYDTYYRRGQPQSDGSISWSANPQLVLSGRVSDPNIDVDANSYVWIGYMDETSHYPRVIMSKETDGTWSTASGFPYTLASYNRFNAQPTALSNGHVYVTYANSTDSGSGAAYPYGRLWNPTSETWGSQEQISTTKTVSDEFFDKTTASAYGNDVHFTYLDDSNDIVYYKRTYGTGWGSVTVLDSNAIALSSPALLINQSSGDLYVFWAENDIIYYRHYTDSWSDIAIWIDKTTDGLKRDDGVGCAYEIYNDAVIIYYLINTFTPYYFKVLITKDSYPSSGTLHSKDFFLQGTNVARNFTYTVDSLPSGTAIKLQFSLDYSSWKDKNGNTGVETLSSGTHIISLNSTYYNNGTFYYMLNFTNTNNDTAILSYVKLFYADYEYQLTGAFSSINMLSSQSDGSVFTFNYTISSLPAGTSINITFSQDNSTWRNSTGHSGWDTLTSGTHIIKLARLYWNGANLYYNCTLGGDRDSTPKIDYIGFVYLSPNCEFSCYWQDNVELSHYIFGTNSTGEWINKTATSLSGTSDWANVTWSLNTSMSVRIEYEWWCNDTSNNWNNTGLQYFVTTGNYAPVINQLRLSTTTSETNITTIDVFAWYDWEANITDTDTLLDIHNLTIRIINNPSQSITDDTPDFNATKEYWFRYLNNTDAWEWYSGSAWTSTSDWLDTDNCAYPTKTGTNGWYLFRVKLNKIARKSVSWHFSALVYDSADNNANKNFTDITLNGYAEIVIITTTHTWTNVQPNTQDTLIDEGSITINVTCNYGFKLQAQGNASYLIDAESNQIAIGNITIHKDTLGSSISLTTSWADILGLTSLPACNEVNTQRSFKLWLDVPNGTESGSYQYKCELRVTES